jgi:hypothetical protein
MYKCYGCEFWICCQYYHSWHCVENWHINHEYIFSYEFILISAYSPFMNCLHLFVHQMPSNFLLSLCNTY